LSAAHDRGTDPSSLDCTQCGPDDLATRIARRAVDVEWGIHDRKVGHYLLVGYDAGQSPRIGVHMPWAIDHLYCDPHDASTLKITERELLSRQTRDCPASEFAAE